MFGIALTATVLCVVFTAFFADRPSDVGADASVEFDGGTSPFEAQDLPGSRTSLTSNETITSVPFLLVFLSWVLLSTPIYIVISHIVSYATSIGIGRSEGVPALTVIGIAATIARFGIGALADRIGRTRTFITSVCVSSARRCSGSRTPRRQRSSSERSSVSESATAAVEASFRRWSPTCSATTTSIRLSP